MERLDLGHPYRWRTWFRGHLPWFLINLGVAAKAQDCETVGARHRWYNADDVNSACYHCKIVRTGQLWRSELERMRLCEAAAQQGAAADEPQRASIAPW
jgi:hypothetical protein